MFKRQNFCHIASNNRNNVKVGVFVYRTTDDVTTVTTSGYFNERIIDINLHDLIIHEQINIADTTIVERNVLCVIKRTADNVETKVIKSNWQVQVELTLQQLANLALNDLADVTISNPTVGQYLRWNGVEWINMDGDGGGGSGVWGAITGDINDQADLQSALSDKANVDLDNLSATGQAKFDAKANVDMDNLTDTGANIANWSHNVTNCITEIPQDIIIDFDSANRTATLKAGSKIYVPAGLDANNDPIFNPVIISTDLLLDPGHAMWNNEPHITVVKSDGSYNIPYATRDVFSGNTAPTVIYQNAIWYDTSTNLIKVTSDYGSTWTTDNLSLPICFYKETGGFFDSIDQVFNGFGYIGTATFVLPGVKALVPDGRNPDGTCKSTELSFTEVKVHELVYNNEVSHYCILTPNGLYGYGAESIFVSDTRPLPTIDFPTYAFWYDVPNNYIWTTNDNGVTWNPVNNGIFVGSMQKPSTGNITNLNPDQPFKAIDRSDIIDLLEMIYPVGAIYTTTVNSTECPMRLVIPGSTWQLVATDRALWGGNGSNAGTTIAAGLPDGRGAFTESGANVTSVGGGMHKASSYSAGWGSTGGDNTATVEYRNSWWNSIFGQSTTVQPPAYRVNVWRRTA